MPYDLRIVRSKDFIRMDADGHFDMAVTRRLFIDVIWACASSGIGRLLLDIREATADMTAAQLYDLANVCGDLKPPSDGHKIAILSRPEFQLERAALVATTARFHGWNFMAFREFEEAFEWLIN